MEGLWGSPSGDIRARRDSISPLRGAAASLTACAAASLAAADTAAANAANAWRGGSLGLDSPLHRGCWARRPRLQPAHASRGVLSGVRQGGMAPRPSQSAVASHPGLAPWPRNLATFTGQAGEPGRGRARSPVGRQGAAQRVARAPRAGVPSRAKRGDWRAAVGARRLARAG